MKRQSERATILVVDDEPGILRAATRILSREHHVLTTTSPQEAVELIRQSRPDIAIVDVLMPEMSGFELMARIRKARRDLDIIVMTGNPFEVDNNLIRAIEEGAFYFLQKPFDRRVLLTLVGRCLELRHLRRQREQYVANLERELRAAKIFQQSLLPPQDSTICGVSIAASYVACDALAGDLYDYVPVGDDAVALLVADVSGHGASAAMLTGIVKSAFHAAHADGHDPLAVVNRIADNLRSFDASRFVTVFAARLDGDTLTYVSAGHTPGLLISSESPPQPLSSTGPLISSGFPNAYWEAMSTRIEPHHQLLIYTDGLPETRGSDGLFGHERIVDAATRSGDRGRRLIEAIMDEIRLFADERPLTDDITVLLAERVTSEKMGSQRAEAGFGPVLPLP